MRPTRQILAGLILFVLLLPLPVAAAEAVRVSLLHFNDLYEVASAEGRGGPAELRGLLMEERSRAANSITTFGGDLLSPSLLSAETHGAHMIDLLRLMGVEVATPGNHEFDFGAANAEKLLRASGFTWVSSNIVDADGKAMEGTVSVALRRIGGVTIGFLGLLEPATVDEARLAPDKIRIAPPAAAARAAIAMLKAEGAEAVVALTHQSLEEDRLLARTVEGIDLILGGHEHVPMAVIEHNVPIVKAGSDAQWLARIDLAVSPGGGARLTGWHLLASNGQHVDPEVAAMAARAEERLSATLDQPIGSASTAFETRSEAVRGRENPFANFITDAMRQSTGADLALMNGGGIRGDRIYKAGTTLTPRDVLREMPFGNRLVVLEVSGSALRAALEHGLSKVEAPSGRFPQVSGLTLSYDPGRPAGGRIREIAVGGKPLDGGARYKLAISDFMLRGGDGYGFGKDARVLGDPDDAPLLANAVIDAIRSQGAIAPQVEGRVVESR